MKRHGGRTPSPRRRRGKSQGLGLAILRQAAAIRETGELLLHVGECQARTGALLEALKTWTNAQQAATTEKDKATLAALGPRIDELRTRIPSIALRIPKGATNVQVKVDDTPEPSDKPILVNPGDHTVMATADGRAPFSTKVTLGEKDTKVVEIDLGGPVMGDSGLDAPKTTSANAGPAIPLGRWIGGGAAVVLLVGGILSFAAAGGAATDGATACATAVTCDSSQKSKVQTLERCLPRTMWIGAGASAGFATHSWYFMKRPKSEPAAPPAPAAAVTVGTRKRVASRVVLTPPAPPRYRSPLRVGPQSGRRGAATPETARKT